MIYPQDFINSVICGNALDVLKTFPAESIDCVITSPPYWSLRTYKSDPVIWGGDEQCEHKFEKHNRKLHSGRGDFAAGDFVHGKDAPDTIFEDAFCSLCGCWKGELGLEPTFDLYIQHLVSIFDEVKRVLKKEGSCWVNLGDNFGAGNRKTNVADSLDKKEERGLPVNLRAGGFEKSRLLIPERFAIEMVNRGWTCREELIWSKQILDFKEMKTKGSAMPTSVKTRFNCTHEKLYHFVKNTEPLWWTNSVTGESVRVQPKGTHGEEGQDWEWIEHTACEGKGCDSKRCVNGQRKSSLWEGHDVYFNLDAVRIKSVRNWQLENWQLERKAGDNLYTPKSLDNRYGNYAGKFTGSDNPEAFGSPRARTQRKDERGKIAKEDGMITFYSHSKRGKEFDNPSGKNLPSVWLISPEPTKEKHFAAYPTKLCHIPILTTCPPGGVVLDPFCGTNTTGKVAEKLGRSWIGIDIQENYKAIANRKLAQTEIGIS